MKGDQTLFYALEEISAELQWLEWECSQVGLMAHYTGRGAEWTVQLVCLDNGQRMGTAVKGNMVMKLTDELAEKAERLATGVGEHL